MIRLKEFTKEEAAGLARDWLDVFGRERRGMNTGAFMWHIFSGGRFPALENDEARAEYRDQVCCEFIVLSNDRDAAFLTDTRPEDRVFSDFYVFPPNLAWTMAFTHEDGWLGPYFARHPRYDELNLANIAKVRKQQEIARARAQGWMAES